MKVTVDLTTTGLENWKQVALAMFKYVNLLRAEPPSSSAFDEIKAIADISFKFAERTKTSRYATALCTWMQRPLPREKIVSGISLLEEFNPEHVALTLQMLDPRKAMVGVTSKEMPKDVTATFDQKEPIYGTEYAQIKLSDEFMKEVCSHLSFTTTNADTRLWADLPFQNCTYPGKTRSFPNVSMLRSSK